MKVVFSSCLLGFPTRYDGRDKRLSLPPIPGTDLPGVVTCWTLEDARAIAEKLQPGNRVVMVGAGFVAGVCMKSLVGTGVKLSVIAGRAGQILFYLAGKAEKAGQQDAANAYLAKIITDYPADQNYTRALSKRAWKSYADKDYSGAIKGLALFIKESQASPTKAQAMFALADSLRRTGK